MQRYFVQISFKGTNYHGWQIQPNAITIQELVEKAFTTIMKEKISVVGAGRTDAGVHASFFIFHYEADQTIIDPYKFVFRLNSFLPADISIHNIYHVPSDIHARFSAISRTYRYYITCSKDPFNIDTAYYYPRKLNLKRMNEAASILKCYNDFSCFSRSHTDVKTNLCKIFIAEWQKKDNLLVFTIKADRFLRNMVRAIVGTLLDIGLEKIDTKGFHTIIRSRNRCAAGASAPAHGLFLEDIAYPLKYGVETG